MNFSGIGFEVGQSQRGLTFSTEGARSYFPLLKKMGLHLFDQGDTAKQTLQSQIKIFSESDLQQIEFEKYQQAYHKTQKLLKSKTPLLNWGGDHSIALSTVGAFTHEFPDGFVLWIDAHADLNLPSKSLSGNFHGMPVSVLLNLDGVASAHFPWLKTILNHKKLIYLGLRDLDSFELSVIDTLKIKAFTHQHILSVGIENIASEILALTSGHPLHISFDIDSMDPNFAPSTGVPVPQGLTPSHLEILSERLFRHSKVRSLDIVEVNPGLGTSADVEKTYRTAFHFLSSVFYNQYQGEFYAGVGKRNQRKYCSQVESSP